MVNWPSESSRTGLGMVSAGWMCCSPEVKCNSPPPLTEVPVLKVEPPSSRSIAPEEIWMAPELVMPSVTASVPVWI